MYANPKDINSIDQHLNDHSACIIQNCVKQHDIDLLHGRLRATPRQKYKAQKEQDGRYGLVHTAPPSMPIHYSLYPLRRSLSTLFGLEQSRGVYIDLLYHSTPKVQQTGMDLHMDAPVQYTILFPSINGAGELDNRLYLEDSDVFLGLDEVLVIAGSEGPYDPCYHGVKWSPEKRHSHLLVCYR